MRRNSWKLTLVQRVGLQETLETCTPDDGPVGMRWPVDLPVGTSNQVYNGKNILVEFWKQEE